jgi:DeoR/GlpR family transcriptional regulator of sugar metabolism
VNVELLMREYNVSVETIRRDLRILDDRGYVKRIYGGAVKVEQSAGEIPFQERLGRNQAKKEAIAREAVKFLEDGDSLFLDGKTTCLAFAKHIPAHLELTVVTNSVTVAQHLIENNKKCTVFMTGGELNEDGMITGPKLHQELKEYRFEKAFFSTIALDATGCFYTRVEPQQLARTLAEVSSKLILLADSSKINKVALLLGISTDDLDVVITDDEAPESYVRDMQLRSCQLVLAAEEQS